MATSLSLENDSSLAQGYLKVNGSTAATLTTSGITGNLTGNVTGSLTQGGSLTLATAQTASGTSVDFTGIPSWAKRITVMFNLVLTSGTSQVQIQLGSGTFSISGYSSTASYSGTAGADAFASTGFITEPVNAASPTITRSGLYQFILLGSNNWVGSGNIGTSINWLATNSCGGNSPTLSGTLDRIRITTINGTDTFTGGTINISYE